MNVNQKIEAALSSVVNNSIWPLCCPLESLPDEYITYLPELENPEEFADDEDIEWVPYMQVHWFKKSESGKPVNYLNAKKTIRKKLKESGFTITDIAAMHEKETGYT